MSWYYWLGKIKKKKKKLKKKKKKTSHSCERVAVFLLPVSRRKGKNPPKNAGGQ